MNKEMAKWVCEHAYMLVPCYIVPLHILLEAMAAGGGGGSIVCAKRCSPEISHDSVLIMAKTAHLVYFDLAPDTIYSWFLLMLIIILAS
jgi:hypothetical protein